MKKTRLCKLLNIEHPVIQAPMNWITGAELASAVSNAGGLGVIGPNPGLETETSDVKETGEILRRQIRKTKSLTKKPFAVNIMSASNDLRPGGRPYSDQCAKVVIEESVPIAVLTGDKPGMYMKQFKDAGIKVLHRALPVSSDIARNSEQDGVDAFIAVGFEGGGHTGFYRIPTLVLIPQIVESVQIPVIAGGGISTGREMAAALVLGAEGVFMGTRFIVADECPAHPNVKKAIINADDTSTVTIEGLHGLILRVMKNPVIERCILMKENGHTVEEITNLYRSCYRKGMLEGDIDGGTFIFGAGAGSIKEQRSAGVIVSSIVKEAQQILQNFKT